MPYDNWMFCLIATILLVFVGDVFGLIYAGMFYYLALAKFNKKYP